MEAALRALLLANSGLSALVQKVAWFERPQGSALPAILMQKATIDRGYTMDGPDGYHGETVQFDIWAKPGLTVLQIRDALLAVLESGGIRGGVQFTTAFLNSERQTAEDVAGVGSVFRVSLDAVVWWEKI